MSGPPICRGICQCRTLRDSQHRRRRGNQSISAVMRNSKGQPLQLQHYLLMRERPTTAEQDGFLHRELLQYKLPPRKTGKSTSSILFVEQGCSDLTPWYSLDRKQSGYSGEPPVLFYGGRSQLAWVAATLKISRVGFSTTGKSSACVQQHLMCLPPQTSVSALLIYLTAQTYSNLGEVPLLGRSQDGSWAPRQTPLYQ